MTIYLRPRKEDLNTCADILLNGFYQQIKFFLGSRVSSQLLTDFLKVFLKYEKKGFIVSQTDKEISGFILVLTRARRLLFGTLTYSPTLLTKFLMGDYSISPKRLLFSVKQFLFFYHHSSRFHTRSSAQILLLVVGEKFRGKGIGRELLRSGLDYLKSKSVSYVQLEVRADNLVALHLYSKEGFIPKAKIETAIGTSLIMTLSLITH